MTLRPILALLLTLLLAIAGLTAAPIPAQADPADIEAAARGVVRVIIIGDDGDNNYTVSHGTGFSVGNERIITNAHVVREAIEDKDLAIGLVPADGGDAVYARVIAVSPRNDLALLRTTKPIRLPAIAIAANAPAQSGAVTAIGYPANVDLAQGLKEADMFRPQPPVTSTGFLSGRRPSREFDTLLHTAPIGRGNSGGPLVDDCGRLIGVNSFGAESQGTDAEFFFAVSNRELLPFLRANGVTPSLNGLPCRSIADLDAAQAAREDRERAAEEARAQTETAREAERAENLRRTIMYEVFDERGNRQFLALAALMIVVAAGGFAVMAHQRSDYRTRAIAGAVAGVALVAALAAWLTRPSFADIETRLEDQLRMPDADNLAQGNADQSGVITVPLNGAGEPSEAAQSLACVLDIERSRVIGAPKTDVPFDWSSDGCVNGRTQYGLANGEWTRVFVPASETAVSINRYDPAQNEYVVDRYLLDRETMLAARGARGAYEPPSCGSGADAARILGSAQQSVTASLPASPNERLVYRCAPASAAPPEN